MSNLTYDQHALNAEAAKIGMVKALEPLNEKLKPLDMMIYFNDTQTMLNPFGSNSRVGLSIYIDDNEIEKMMSMTDEQLIQKTKERLSGRRYR